MLRGDHERDLELVLMGMVLASVQSGKKVMAKVENCELTKEHRELFQSLRNSFENDEPATDNEVLKRWLEKRGVKLNGAAGEAVMDKVAKNGAIRRMHEAAQRVFMQSKSGMSPEEYFEYMKDLATKNSKPK